MDFSNLNFIVALYGLRCNYKDYEFPVTDMPEDIKKFKELSIRFEEDNFKIVIF